MNQSTLNEPTFFELLADSTTFWAIVATSVVLAVAALVANARPPRWLRVRRDLADMAEAARVENEYIAVKALHEARQSPPPWGCTECTTKAVCIFSGCKYARAVES
jgi:hypothetical protein